MSKLVEKIQSRGYWKVVIRPGTFVQKRVPNILELQSILQRCYVRLRGWDFPFLDPRFEPTKDSEWIGQESEWEEFLESWRFYQSGQFVDISAIHYDWQDQSKWHPAPPDWTPGSDLRVRDVVFTFTEIFEFAARLAFTEAGDENMHIETTVGNIAGRELLLDSSRFFPFVPGTYKASLNEFRDSYDCSRTELLAEPRKIALLPTIELFRRFGWEPKPGFLQEIQSEVLDKGSKVIG